MLTELEKQVIAAVQRDMPVRPQPYREMAAALGIGEESFLETLRCLCAKGIIRRFGATLRHQQAGFAANALAAWQVQAKLAESVGRTMAAFPQVSHCYCRNPAGRWPYNLYAMIHGPDEAACRETARQLARRTGIEHYVLLFSLREFKKTSMEYFPADEENG